MRWSGTWSRSACPTQRSSVGASELPKSLAPQRDSMCRQSAAPCLVKSPALAGVSELSVAERLVRLPDPRHRRGLRHPFVSVLLSAACAVLAGARSYAAIGQWAAEAPHHTLARLGARCATVFAVRIAPSAATIRRVITSVCPGGLADLLGGEHGHPAEHRDQHPPPSRTPQHRRRPPPPFPTNPTPDRSTSSACPDQPTYKITRLCNSPGRRAVRRGVGIVGLVFVS
ncbi:transposase family protein [Streptomyces sp. NPDC017673]|uniref:transposase family protein n=1 Tax=unclassified Streptomyces TaxID=2593676 RepID=UPI0037B9B92F